VRVSLQRSAKGEDSDEKIQIIVSKANYSARKDFLVAKKVMSQHDFDLNRNDESHACYILSNNLTCLTSESGYATILIGL